MRCCGIMQVPISSPGFRMIGFDGISMEDVELPPSSSKGPACVRTSIRKGLTKEPWDLRI